MADNKGIDMKQFTEEGLMEISGLNSRREYNRSLVKSRQLADRLVRNYATERGIEYSTLADTIERLYARGAINMNSRDNFHTIRIYGNKAVREADNSEEDAEQAYTLLKNEVETYLSRKQVNVDRTPLRVERPSARRSTASSEVSVPEMAGSRKSQAAGESPSGSRAKTLSASAHEISIYDILKIVMPIIMIILVVIIIKSLLPSGDTTETTTAAPTEIESTEAPAESETEPVTEAETEAQPVLYEISGDGVRIRRADNPESIYTLLSKGDYIGEVEDTDIELNGSHFVSFTMDGVEVIVSSDFITPVEAEE